MNPSSDEHEKIDFDVDYLSNARSSPQHVGILHRSILDVEDNSLSSVSIDSTQEVDKAISHIRGKRGLKQLMKSVSVDTVMKELSDLRASTQKLEGERQHCREDQSDTTSVTMASEIDAKDASSLPQIFQADVYQARSHEMEKLDTAFDSLKMELFLWQAEILQFRISVVTKMMEFSSLNKMIKSEIAPTKPGERLISSCSDIPEDADGESEGYQVFESSCPSLEVRAANSFSGGYDRLLLDMHTILEEVPSEGISDSAGSSKSPCSSPMSPSSLVSSNQLTLISNPICEPDNGHLSQDSFGRRRSFLERVEEPLFLESDMPTSRQSFPKELNNSRSQAMDGIASDVEPFPLLYKGSIEGTASEDSMSLEGLQPK